jgi:hypothetical protein
MCRQSDEFCEKAIVNGVEKMAECHPHQFGCSTCDCARVGAVNDLRQEPACATAMAADLVCTDGTMVIGPQDSSPTLVVACMIP